jgi:phosphoglucomutase
LKTISNQVGSFFPQRDNFRLTPVVKEKFTEKLRQTRSEKGLEKLSTAAKHWIFE